MSSSALVTMLLSNVLVTAVTIYFFFKVLNTPGKLDETDEVEYPHGG